MVTPREKRYLELMRGFSSEELERLPLEYSLYTNDLPKTIGSFLETGPRLHIPELEVLDRLSGELQSSINRQLFLTTPWKPPIVLLPRDRSRIRAERAAALRLATEASADIHRKLLQEYFFLTNFLELTLLVQREVASALGAELNETHVATYKRATAKLIEIFQKTDDGYEQTQRHIIEKSPASA